MPEETNVPISSFPEASSIDGADTVTGLQNNVNTNFKFSTILAWLVNAFRSAFVPAGRTVNNKSLASDITLSASDVGARPDNWTPSAADVTYDNTGSGLSASDVQDALDELAAGAGGSTAASTSYDNTGSGLAATNAQDAIDELSDEKADQITVAPVETSTTASAAHGLGSVFYLGGKLYRALADIPIGGTINTAAGGNATETSIAQNFKRTVTLTSAQYAQLSVAEKTADIVYIITDEPAPSAYTSNPEMDGTASPGSSDAWARGDHVHPSDTSKANQAQLAYGETGTTASRAYAAGEYFCWNGLLYRAKTAISSGGTITPGTNCEQVTGGGFNNVGFIDISSYISINQSRLNNTRIKARYYPGSKKVELQAEGTVATTLSAAQNTVFLAASPYALVGSSQQFAGCGIKNSQTPVAVWANSASINVQHGGASVGDKIALSLSWLLG